MTFLDDLKSRILVLDGAMGTMLQRGFSEEQVLVQYIEAGADIITTNSFNANRICRQADNPGASSGASSWTTSGASSGVLTEAKGNETVNVAFEAAALARRIADASPRKIYVAGSCGPTGKSLTLSSDADDPAARELDFDDFVTAYREQMDALVRGGSDLILLETCFDALNTKAAIYAFGQLGNPLPLVISATVSDRSGRTLTGQTLEAFYRSVSHAPTLAAFGINCALGPVEMAPLVREIASFSSHPLIFYPNAGLPVGDEYDGGTPDIFRRVFSELAADGCINIAGGCCGTTPEHIRAVSGAVSSFLPRCPVESDGLHLSGLESFHISRKLSFTNIGERTNVAGSRKFARLVEASDWTGALAVARAQIEGGADIIDINMDDPMVDSAEKMRVFLRYIAAEPDIARSAIMLDSSHWDTLAEGLRNIPGRSVVNSISLKDGEDEFLRRAREIHSLGAAMVVMAFDEEGQAETFARKIQICSRSYSLLTEMAGIPPSDIIFDCNILSIGTGIDGHSRFGVDYINAVRWIKENLPGVLTSGGVSNLSFAFRGNNAVREAMHSAFLYHAMAAGLDMAIVNPQMLQVYDDIDPVLRRSVEDVIFDSDSEATSRLVELSVRFAVAAGPAPGAEGITSESAGISPGAAGAGEGVAVSSDNEVTDPCSRLSRSLVRGDESALQADTMECLQVLGSAVAVIEGPLMDGMERVGHLFSEGKMFLPQVVKSARTMRSAVTLLTPFLDGEGNGPARPRFVIATVQGDVHDIGKNITATVLRCGGFEVTDLGVMVPSSVILDEAVRLGADIIGVSGLITPSLNRMEELCRMMSGRGMSLPLFVGGAAASPVHTAVRLAPLYPHVYYGSDASATAVLAKRYMSSPESFEKEERAGQEKLRSIRASASSAASVASAISDTSVSPAAPVPSGFLTKRVFKDFPLQSFQAPELLPWFDWKLFSTVCGSSGNDVRDEAIRIINYDGPVTSLCALFFDCRRVGNLLDCGSFVLPVPGDRNSLADFFPQNGTSQLGLFAVCTKDASAGGDDIVRHAVKVTLAEAASAMMSEKFRSVIPDGFKLIMPGIGYSCCPDHSLKRDVLAQLPPEIGISLTDSCAMIPEASICGLVIAHRDAAFFNIGNLSEESLKAYAALRGFTDEEESLFLGHLHRSV